VVITGCGVVSAAGIELDEFWDTLMKGTCCIRPLRHFSAPEMDALVGGEVELTEADALPPEIDPDDRRARCTALALAAARRAVLDSGAPESALSVGGVVFGTTLGEERQVGDISERWKESGLDAVSPEFLSRADNFRVAALVAERYGMTGPVLLSATACSSGNAATAWAYDAVASGATELMLAGGADTFTRLIYCGFRRMGALAKDICRPFDKGRDGVAFGEGAGALVLEELEHARRRGARIYAEIAGYGISNDAYHITAPEPNGDGFARAIRQALATSGVAPEQVDYVSAHGTGTPYNDVGEMRAMLTVFGDRAKAIPLSSIKSIIGHTNGAASAIEGVACALALTRGAVPPTANLREPEPGFDFDHVPGMGRPAALNTCLNLAAGFGGFNVCVVLKRVV
jgi:3-oxoacyl-[acyl-carrier-protein] synthase II